jgi:phage terminase Nu1 subunit (DNA packaging protein)
VALAQSAELELEQKRIDVALKRQRLVPVQEAQNEIERVFTHVRESLISIARRAKQAIPKLTAGDVEKLDRLVRESLEELADEEW